MQQTLSRKQLEIQQRERQILAMARPILLEEGYTSLSMDRLAAKMEFAKGTLYNHFPNKEEIVAALALESLELRRKLFDRAATIRPHSRERMIAIGCACDVYAISCAQHFAVEQMLRNSVIWNKSSQKRQDLIQQYELRVMSIVAGVVRDAIAARDLNLPASMSVEEFVYGFWSLTYGSHTLIASSPSLPDVGVFDPIKTIRYHGWTLMNGYHWQPAITFEATNTAMDALFQELDSYVQDQT